MEKQQFRVLYREFLFRMVDLEVLSSHALGDSNKLLGQFASLLIFFGIPLGLTSLAVGQFRAPAAALFYAWSAEHFLIATTMLVVGLFAVLSWDSTYPDRRDVLVLAPLPVRTRTLFLAKVAAVGTSLALTVGLLNWLAGVAWPLALGIQSTPKLAFPAGGSFPGLLRFFAVYWIAMLSAGAFIFCCVLGLQGLAAQLLPRRLFLRASSFLQLGAFAVIVYVYIMQPTLASPRVLMQATGTGLLSWSPSNWFLGLFQQLNGSPAMAGPAHRAWIGLAVALGVTAAAYALSYFRTLPKSSKSPISFPAPAAGPGCRASAVPFKRRSCTSVFAACCGAANTA